MKEFFKKLGFILLGVTIWYLFVSLCAWDLNPGHWSGFARFFWGIISIIVIFYGSVEI